MAMKVAMVSAAFLVVLLVVESASIAFAIADSFNIINNIDGGQLEVDCGRVGQRTLQKGENFGHEFTLNVWRQTQYNCGFKWGTKVQRFNVWKDDDETLPHVTHKPCEHCEWSVTQEGFSMNEFGNPATILNLLWH